MNIRIAAVSLAACLAAGTASAASSNWHEADGGRVRIVTAGPVDASGVLRGALQIELKPGWKTYWRDPGASGVPPQIEVGAPWSSVVIDFPAPQRHKDDYGSWAGYDHSVALPLTFRSNQPATASIEGSVFLGICETICVPLQATLELTIDQLATPFEDTQVVEAAWSSLPASASEAFGVSGTNVRPDGNLEIQISAPDGPAQLFVAGQDGYSLAMPEAAADRTFHLKVLGRPKTRPSGSGLPYTLVTPAGAVSGFIDYP